MKLTPTPSGYTLRLSAQETWDWAIGHGWPGSMLSGRRVRLEVDSNGLCDLAIDGGRGDQDCPSEELNALVSDHLPAAFRHLWPCWERRAT